jgi:photosystem II stability/assembly factor-like uncharacterized protein
MNEYLLIGTTQGLVICRRAGRDWEVQRRALDGMEVTSVIAREGVILAGARSGVYRSDDLGITWREASASLSVRHIRWLAYHPDISDFELAGTEPAAIFISRDGAETWRECPEVAEMRDRFGWYLPYSPQAGCVRGFAIRGQHAFAAVEDGAVLVSGDGGETWELASGSRGEPEHQPPAARVHSDVHSIEVHPASPLRVYAPTGGGFYRSLDGGAAWDCLYPHSYCRAAWIDPEAPEHLLLGPADGVDRYGRIEESLDGGRTWQPASSGLDTPWPRHMVERFIQVGDELLAVLSNGELLSASPVELRWQPILPEAPGVQAVTHLRA